jgi:membrane protein implicated in regulation of membrane protease activity
VSAFGFLIAWANVPFAIAAGVAALFALLQVTGVLGLIAGGGDGDADHDVDADVDHDVDHDVDTDADHDADADAEHQAHGDRGWGIAALAPLGLGRIPFSVIWQTYALAFALTGFGINLRYLGAAASVPLVSLAWTLPASLASGYVAVALVARLLGPVLSSKDQEATSRAQLVGQIGVVISSKVDQEFGEVRIRDKSGHDVRVICKLPKGTSEPVAEHKSVVVVDYDQERGDLLVEAFDEGDLPGEARRAGS